jgi:hypothetical protein
VKDRKKAFTLKGLMAQMGLEMDKAYMPAMGKAVSIKFKEMCPESETFSRRKTVFFYDEDKECMEELVRQEHKKFVARQVEGDFDEGK